MRTGNNSSAGKPALILYPVILIAVFIFCSCSLLQVKMNPLPPPPPTAKLRVHVVAVTTDTPPPGFWKVPQEEYVENMVRETKRMLRKRGMYEVVSAADVQTVLGAQKIANWEWMRDDWSLAKEVGQALHADYVLCVKRSWKINFQQDMIMFNLHTGNRYEVSNYLAGRLRSEQATIEMIQINYRTLFRDAQSDLLRTAMNKGRVGSEEIKSEKVSGTVPDKKPVAAVGQVKERAKLQERKLTAEEKQLAFEKEMESALADQGKKQNGLQLVVYDFDAAENLKIVGMILTEALREELHKLGGFTLVNRENMAQVMEELKLQQSGLVNEKQAIKLGEWMAANEAVTGHFAVIGKSSILQAKRVDIKTLGTMALGSIKCRTGEEDDLLGSMNELAQKLIQPKKN